MSFTSEAIARLEIPNKNIKVILTGTPSNEEERRIYKEFKNNLTKNKFIEHEDFSDRDMPILYTIADLTVLCSQAEGFGTVYLESMSCECPVIGADVVGTNETIRHGFNGSLCRYGDHENLINVITELLTNKALCKKYIDNGLKLMDTKYNLKKQAKQHLELYEKYYKQKNIAKCIIYRKKESKTEILVQRNRKSLHRLPTVTKGNSESWLEAAIKESRKVTNINLLFPKHLLLDRIRKGEVGYSFEVEDNNKLIRSDSEKEQFLKWVELDEAIDMVFSKSDKRLLDSFEKRLNINKFNQNY